MFEGRFQIIHNYIVNDMASGKYLLSERTGGKFPVWIDTQYHFGEIKRSR